MCEVLIFSGKFLLTHLEHKKKKTLFFTAPLFPEICCLIRFFGAGVSNKKQ